MPYQSFESLDVWKRGCRLAVRVYKELRNCRDYGLKDQMTRAGVSIASNIAEGYERGSNKDFIRFLNIAKGSAAELRTQLYIAEQIDVIEMEKRKELVTETIVISRMLQKLADSRRDQVREDDEIPNPDILNLISTIDAPEIPE